MRVLVCGGMKPSYKQMASGKLIDLNNLKEDDISLSDISKSLNSIIRFDGHWGVVRPLTVAQHSMLCLNMAVEDEPKNKELHKRVFMHDFSECYIGDLGKPVKNVLGDKWDDFARPIEDLIEVSLLGYNLSPYMHKIVKHYDHLSFYIEQKIMWGEALDTKHTKHFYEAQFREIDIEKIWEELQ